MINFPTATAVHKHMPKNAFYRNLSLPNILKEKFVSDVDKIVVENSLTKENLNLSADSKIEEIMLLSISLKKQEFDGKIVEAIAKQNPHKLIFLLIYEDERQLAVYHRKLYRTEWMNEDDIFLNLKGFSLDEIWNSFVEQIALNTEHVKQSNDFSLDERLATQDEIKKLEKLRDKTKAAAWKEPQPKKKFELYERLQSYEQQLEELRNGKA